MRRLLAFGTISALATTGLAMATAVPAFAVVPCNNTTLSGTINDTVVATGNFCILSGANVSGNVVAKPGTSLIIDRSRVHGSVLADTPTAVIITLSTVDGSVTVTGATGFSGILIAGGICASTIWGSLTYSNSGAGSVFTVGTGTSTFGRNSVTCGSPGPNRIGGGVVFSDNQGNFNFGGNAVGGNVRAVRNSGGGSIDDNSINGSLACSVNSPPVTQSNNKANGSITC